MEPCGVPGFEPSGLAGRHSRTAHPGTPAPPIRTPTPLVNAFLGAATTGRRDGLRAAGSNPACGSIWTVTKVLRWSEAPRNKSYGGLARNSLFLKFYRKSNGERLTLTTNVLAQTRPRSSSRPGTFEVTSPTRILPNSYSDEPSNGAAHELLRAFPARFPRALFKYEIAYRSGELLCRRRLRQPNPNRDYPNRVFQFCRNLQRRNQRLSLRSFCKTNFREPPSQGMLRG